MLPPTATEHRYYCSYYNYCNNRYGRHQPGEAPLQIDTRIAPLPRLPKPQYAPNTRASFPVAPNTSSTGSYSSNNYNVGGPALPPPGTPPRALADAAKQTVNAYAQKEQEQFFASKGISGDVDTFDWGSLRKVSAYITVSSVALQVLCLCICIHMRAQ